MSGGGVSGEVGAGAKRAAVTIESLMAELEEARIGATSVEQFAAATSAGIAKAKLKGLMVDRLAVGPASDFASCETTEQVVDKLLDQQSPADALLLLDQFRDLIGRRAADRADIVDAPLVPQASNEAAKVIELFRPARKGRR